MPLPDFVTYVELPPIRCPQCQAEVTGSTRGSVFSDNLRWYCSPECEAAHQVQQALRREACICNHNPETTDGPDIECPVHGLGESDYP